MYTAAVLEPTSAVLLRWIARSLDIDKKGFLFQTQQEQALPHHMTINLGKINIDLNSESILGVRAKMEVLSIFWNEELGACAALVGNAYAEISEWSTWEKLVTINTYPHITIGLKEGVPAKTSNKIFSREDSEWFTPDKMEIRGGYDLLGKIEEVE